MRIRTAIFVVVICTVLVFVLGATRSARVEAQNDEPNRVVVEFEERNDSGVRGTAVLTAEGDQTLVVLDVRGAPGEHPDHIHRSTCADPEPNPLFPLSDVVLSTADEEGHSETVVDVPLADLLAEPHVILIHKSASEIDVYIACADITADTAAPSEESDDSDDGETIGVPNTGVGYAVADSAGLMAWLVGTGAISAVLMGWAVRRRGA